jgi:hypothetical protein
MLKFEPKEAAAAEEQSTEPAPAPRPAAKLEAFKPAKRAPDEGQAASQTARDQSAGETAREPEGGVDGEGAEAAPAKVVSIDAFRKKT